MSKRVGILAIQGDVAAHAAALARVGAEAVTVRRAKELDGLDALILPGGESTTISKGLARLALVAWRFLGADGSDHGTRIRPSRLRDWSAQGTPLRAP